MPSEEHVESGHARHIFDLLQTINRTDSAHDIGYTHPQSNAKCMRCLSRLNATRCVERISDGDHFDRSVYVNQTNLQNNRLWINMKWFKWYNRQLINDEQTICKVKWSFWVFLFVLTFRRNSHGVLDLFPRKLSSFDSRERWLKCFWFRFHLPRSNTKIEYRYFPILQ